MKKSEQKKLTWMHQKIIFFCVWIGLMVAVIMVHIVPKFHEINTLRADLRNSIGTYEKYQITGPAREELNTNQEIQRILDSEEGRTFFQNYYIKSADDKRNYLAFLQDRYEDIKNNQAEEELKARERELSTVIPYFEQWLGDESTQDEDSDTKNLSHFTFINYIERLLYTFNLTNEAPLGVQAVYPVDMKTSDIGSIISYIPLQLNLSGSSSDILEFLWFIQHVALIDDVANPNKLTLERDVVLETALLNRRITGQEKKDEDDYNIYANQLVDIEEIFFPEYIDRGVTTRGKSVDTIEQFLNFVKQSDQGQDYENLEIRLRFYVRSLPIYKLELAIQDTIQNYDQLSAQLEQKIAQLSTKSTQADSEVIKKHMQLKNYLQTHQNSIDRLRNADIKRNINDNYEIAKTVANDIRVISQQIQ